MINNILEIIIPGKNKGSGKTEENIENGWAICNPIWWIGANHDLTQSRV